MTTEIKNEIAEANYNRLGQNALADEILTLQREQDRIETLLKERKDALLQLMLQASIKTIRTESGINFTVAKKSNDKVDVANAWEFLESVGMAEEFKKLDESKFKKMWPEHELIKQGEPTVYLSIR